MNIHLKYIAREHFNNCYGCAIAFYYQCLVKTYKIYMILMNISLFQSRFCTYIYNNKFITKEDLRKMN